MGIASFDVLKNRELSMRRAKLLQPRQLSERRRVEAMKNG
jgi:hypothetical protein